MAREYHVAKYGNDKNLGTKESPFFTISRAAKLADEGDTVIVHEGEYREWVKPEHGARNELGRIVYMAAEGEKAVGMRLLKHTCLGSCRKVSIKNYEIIFFTKLGKRVAVGFSCCYLFCHVCVLLS